MKYSYVSIQSPEKSMAYVLHQALNFFHLPSSVFTPIMEERISTEASVSSFKKLLVEQTKSRSENAMTTL